MIAYHTKVWRKLRNCDRDLGQHFYFCRYMITRYTYAMRLLFPILLIVLVSCGDSASTAASAGGIDLSGYMQEDVAGSDAKHVIQVDNLGYSVAEGIVRDGKRDGVWIEYHPGTHIPASIVSYVNGVPNGPTIFMDQRGQVEEKQGLSNGQLHGMLAKYDYGKPAAEMNYKNGKLNGLARTYYDGRHRGKLQQEVEYKEGLQHGKFVYYNEEGVKTLEYVYKDGEKVSGGMTDGK